MEAQWNLFEDVYISYYDSEHLFKSVSLAIFSGFSFENEQLILLGLFLDLESLHPF